MNDDDYYMISKRTNQIIKSNECTVALKTTKLKQ
jgi:hypothetical protein